MPSSSRRNKKCPRSRISSNFKRSRHCAFYCIERTSFHWLQGSHRAEKMHCVKFDTIAYKNGSACREVRRVNFIAILIDGTTVKEQEVLYVMEDVNWKWTQIQTTTHIFCSKRTAHPRTYNANTKTRRRKGEETYNHTFVVTDLCTVNFVYCGSTRLAVSYYATTNALITVFHSWNIRDNWSG